MPSYTIKNRSTSEEYDVVCTYPELQELLAVDDDLIQKPASPRIVSGVGNLHSKRPEGFTDLLKSIKKTSGRGNTIKI
jgi:hypothetical protein